MTTIDWGKPIEAVHEDGRVVPATLGEVSGYVSWKHGTSGWHDPKFNVQPNGSTSWDQWTIRNVPQQTPTPDVVGSPPDYVPPHKKPVWLSSEDVKAQIVCLAESGADKAVCWDMLQAVNGLVARALAAGDRS